MNELFNAVSASLSSALNTLGGTLEAVFEENDDVLREDKPAGRAAKAVPKINLDSLSTDEQLSRRKGGSKDDRGAGGRRRSFAKVGRKTKSKAGAPARGVAVSAVVERVSCEQCGR